MVTVLKATLITFGVGTLIYYYALPVIAKRSEFLVEGAGNELVHVSLLPYMIFAAICSGVAGYAWYAGI